MAYEILKETAQIYFGIGMTDAQTLVIGDRDEDLFPYILGVGDSMDTADRDLLISLIVQDVLGEGRYWPVNGQGSEAMAQFVAEFAPAARAKGYILSKEVWPDAAEAVEYLLKTLKSQVAATKKTVAQLEVHFKDLLLAKIPVGTILDISKPGLGNRAMVVRGRGYGQEFRTLSDKFRICIDTTRPYLSNWEVTAISIDASGKELGKPVTLRGRLFPAHYHDLSKGDIESLTAEGLFL